ncbi:MAG: isochorismatase family protein [Clostridiaceae bacterium]|nr:isochorismatase family protein [Clostridiaceae bacterium]
MRIARKYYPDPKRAILLVIDEQERLLPVIHEWERVVERTEVLLRGARLLDIPIVVTEQYPRGLGATVEPLASLLAEYGVIAHDKRSFSAVPLGKEPFLAFIEASCYQGNKVGLNKSAKGKDDMSPQQRDQVIIVGVETHVCVWQTTRDLLARGFDVFVPIDAVSSRNQQNNQVGLDLMCSAGAVISCTETLLFDILGTSQDSRFKEISALIK